MLSGCGNERSRSHGRGRQLPSDSEAYLVAEKFLIPIYLPRWMHQPLVRAKRFFIPSASVGRGMKGTWIDIGAHAGELTLRYALDNPGLRIYAFEPNLRLAARLMGRAPNYLVVPVAVSETDGSAEFHFNENDYASSLLKLNEEAVRSWVGVGDHVVKSTSIVPTMRLDTFMELLEIEKVDYLKIDTQGMDLAVLRSAGDKLKNVEKITLEVGIAATPLYVGAPTKDEVLDFLGKAGFTCAESERQTFDQEENLTFVRK
jgi:FkbM family methyltransferase